MLHYYGAKILCKCDVILMYDCVCFVGLSFFVFFVDIDSCCNSIKF